MRMDKTTRKVQIVFDCAATCKCNGIALSIGSCVVQVHARVRRVLHNLCSTQTQQKGRHQIVTQRNKGSWREHSARHSVTSTQLWACVRKPLVPLYETEMCLPGWSLFLIPVHWLIRAWIHKTVFHWSLTVSCTPESVETDTCHPCQWWQKFWGIISHL